MAPKNPSYYTKARLIGFTRFGDTEIEFVPGINAFVGENGTGKTHLLKVLYAIQSARSAGRRRSLEYLLKGIFQTDKLRDLVESGLPGDSTVGVDVYWGEQRGGFDLGPATEDDDATLIVIHKLEEAPRPIFIPAIDMMGHTRRFLSTFDEYQIDFDLTHRDIVALLLSPERRATGGTSELADLLSSLLGGKVEEESERFYLRTDSGRQPMPLVAEGLRKIATLQQLIRNGFLEPGSVLFWDEPEANVNPKLMDEIVDVLLRLARSGVQVFLATHSYVILKELDLQATADDQVRYFALEPTENGTVVHQTDDYATLEPNPISEQFDSLYDRQLEKSTQRRRRR